MSRGASFGSWTALLAATALGVPSASTVRAEVRAETELSEGRDYRLVVQSYDPADRDAVFKGRAHPVGSVQRSVTADELRHGVRVDLMELRQSDSGGDAVSSRQPGRSQPIDDAARGNLAKSLVLAWVEEGKPDLELDARRARPMPGSLVGTVGREPKQDTVRIAVKRGVAA